MIKLESPIRADRIDDLKAGDQIEISGRILCGRDSVLPRLVALIREKNAIIEAIGLEGAVIFHTAVSPAGVGPTTSNKVEIEESIPVLSSAGVRIHIGKGSVGAATVVALKAHKSIFAVTPPVSALFSQRICSQKVIAFEEEGIEALFELHVRRLPAIVAVAHGHNIFLK